MPTIQKKEQSMIAVDYTPITMPFLLDTTDQEEYDFRSNIALQTQGIPVMFKNNDAFSTEMWALAFATAYPLATEVAFLQDENLILIFSHEDRHVVHLQNPDDQIAKEILKQRKKIPYIQDVAIFSPEHTIDIHLLWDQTKKTGDMINRTKEFLKLIAKQNVPCGQLILKGDIPPLPLFAVLYLMRSIARKIVYVNASGVSITLFN